MGWSSGLQLRLLEGPESGRVLPLLAKRLKVGRRLKAGGPPGDSLWIDDATISRLHADLKWLEKQRAYLLTHRSGTNLTRVNGNEVEKHILVVGDRIGMGSGLLELQRVVSAAPPKPSQPPGALHCPRDKTALTPSAMREVPFHSCSYCNGAFLESGKLARIHGQDQDLPMAVPVHVSSVLHCPSCDIPMGKDFLPRSGGVEVVRCQHCLGVWLDTDGLKELLQGVRRSQGGALPAVASEADAPPQRASARPQTPPTPAPASDPVERLARLKNARSVEVSLPKKADSMIGLADQLLREAVLANASDIHIEGVRDEVRVRYRVDGQMTVAHILPKSVQATLVNRFQVLANLDISNPFLPQDGHFLAEVDGSEHDFRIATVPSERGPACVIRVLAVNREIATVDKLGLHSDDLARVTGALDRNQGFILTTGPSGSGKTTTLYALIQALCARPIKTVTIEDPVEYRLDQVVQVPVHHKVGMDFARGLRSVLRLDPDAILVGEIRDRETAEIAVQASLTGHLILSTLHTRGTVESIFRLIDMGIEPYLAKEVLNCIIAQRLVRILCRHCWEGYEPEHGEIRELGMDPATMDKATFYRPKGCEHCMQMGYKGRTAVMEVLVGNEDIREAIQNRATAQVLRNLAVQAGMRPLPLNAFDKVWHGVTSFAEVRPLLG